MKTGPMHISEMERLISNNIYERCGGFTIHSSNARGGARKGIATDATFAFGNPIVGEWMNVSVPDIPEQPRHVWNPHLGRRQFVAGWRQILSNLVSDGTIRLGPDVRRVLGSIDANQINQDRWREKYEDPEISYWNCKKIPSVAESNGRHLDIQAAQDAAGGSQVGP